MWLCWDTRPIDCITNKEGENTFSTTLSGCICDGRGLQWSNEENIKPFCQIHLHLFVLWCIVFASKQEDAIFTERAAQYRRACHDFRDKMYICFLPASCWLLFGRDAAAFNHFITFRAGHSDSRRNCWFNKLTKHADPNETKITVNLKMKAVRRPHCQRSVRGILINNGM